MSYAFLADAKIQQRANETFDNDKMYFALLDTSSRVDDIFAVVRGWPFFEPYVGVRQFVMTDDLVSALDNRLDLPYPLLAFTSVVINGVNVTSSVTAAPFTGAAQQFPTDALYIDTSSADCTSTWQSLACSSSLCSPLGVVITGTWGMVKDWDVGPFIAEDAVQNPGGINASATSITVADADGVNFQGLTPRFSRGQLIQIGSEWMRIIASGGDAGPVTNVLTVRRAQNGTTAAAHALNAPISVFYPSDAIRGIVAAQAAAYYERRGGFADSSFDGVTITRFPADLLQRLERGLQQYANL